VGARTCVYTRDSIVLDTKVRRSEARDDVKRARGPVFLTVCLVAGGTLSGCAVTGTSSAACGSEAGFSTPASAFEAADAVAIGEITAILDDESVDGMSAYAWSATVDQWLKGKGVDPSITINLAIPDCPGGYPEPTLNSLLGETPVVLFLENEGGHWWALNAVNGAVAADPDGGLPATW